MCFMQKMQGNIQKAIQEIKKGELDEKFRTLYVEEKTADLQKERYIRALEQFEEIYGDAEVQVYSAPGRTEVGGNHTDHQLGRVLAASLNLDVIAVVSLRSDKVVRYASEGFPVLSIKRALSTSAMPLSTSSELRSKSISV